MNYLAKIHITQKRIKIDSICQRYWITVARTDLPARYTFPKNIYYNETTDNSIKIKNNAKIKQKLLK